MVDNGQENICTTITNLKIWSISEIPINITHYFESLLLANKVSTSIKQKLKKNHGYKFFYIHSEWGLRILFQLDEINRVSDMDFIHARKTFKDDLIACPIDISETTLVFSEKNLISLVTKTKILTVWARNSSKELQSILNEST